MTQVAALSEIPESSMKRIVGLALAASALLGATTSADEKIEALFPLKVGSVWTYRVVDSQAPKPAKDKTKSKDAFKSKDALKSKDEPESKDEPKIKDEPKEELKSKDEPKKMDETKEPLTIQIKVEKKVKFGKDEGYELVTLANGKVNATEQVAVKADGVYRESVNGLKPDVPFKILALPAVSGAKWSVKSVFDSKMTLSGDFSIKEEDVTVGGVKHPMATLVESKSLKVSDIEASMKCWFVKDIGIVKFEYRLGDQAATLELEKFEKK